MGINYTQLHSGGFLMRKLNLVVHLYVYDSRLFHTKHHYYLGVGAESRWAV